MTKEFIIGAIMVKNEKERILKTIKSTLPYINYFIIYDTGSIDGTQELLKEFFLENKIKYELYEGEFIDYSTSRNYLLRRCQDKSEYLLLLDSNDQVFNLDICINYLKNNKENRECIYNKFKLFDGKDNTIVFQRICCIKNSDKIGTQDGLHYIYPVHEMLVDKNFKLGEQEKSADYSLVGLLDRDREYYFYQDRSQDKTSKDRYFRDLKLLKDFYSKNKNPRILYYICQTLNDIAPNGADSVNAELASNEADLPPKEGCKAPTPATKLEIDLELFKHALELIKYKKEGEYMDYIYNAYIFLGISSYKMRKGQPINFFLKAYEYSKNYIERAEPYYYIACCFYHYRIYREAKEFIDKASLIKKPPPESLRYLILKDEIYHSKIPQLQNEINKLLK